MRDCELSRVKLCRILPFPLLHVLIFILPKPIIRGCSGGGGSAGGRGVGGCAAGGAPVYMWHGTSRRVPLLGEFKKNKKKNEPECKYGCRKAFEFVQLCFSFCSSPVFISSLTQPFPFLLHFI